MASAVLFIAALAFNAVASIPAPVQLIDMPMQCQYDGIIGHCATVEECPHSGTSGKDSSRTRTCQRYGMVCCPLPTSQLHAAPKTSEGTPASEHSSTYEDVVNRVLDAGSVAAGAGGALNNDKCEKKNNLTKLPDPECCGREAAWDEINATNQDRIYNGVKAKREQFPWLVRTYKHEESKKGVRYVAICAGALVGARHVLTAKHCDDVAHQNHIDSVGLGCGVDENKPKECEKRIEVAQVISAESADIIIVLLIESAPYTDTIRPICLPSASEPARLVDGEKREYSIAGWGRTESKRRSKHKMYAKVPHVPIEECKRTVRELCQNGEGNEDICGTKEEGNRIEVVLEGRICAGGETKDPCVGDSGGPLMLDNAGRYVAVGIVTSQTKKKRANEDYSCGERGVPNLFIDLGKHLDWIRDSLKE